MSTDLGLVELLSADAVGQPGQRRFRLFARGSRGSILLWIEKEYLNNLSLTLDRVLAQLTEGQVLRTEAQAGNLPAPSGMPGNFPRTPDYEFEVGQIGLTYDESSTMFLMVAMPMEIIMEGDQEPVARIREEDAVSFFFTQEQAHALTSTINAVVIAGRPVCPLCHTPLDGSPHACVKQNGHREIVQVEEDDEGGE